MLLEIRVRNFAVIDAVTTTFGPGLNVLTGETGAGKSMLLDAILLIRGARAQTDVIRTDTETATVEAVFDVAPRSPAAAVLEEAGLGLDQGQLVVRRELSRSGPARRSPAPAGVGARRRATPGGRGGGVAGRASTAPARRTPVGWARRGRWAPQRRRQLGDEPIASRRAPP